MLKLFSIIIVFFTCGCISRDFHDFLTHKEIMEKKYGPCKWNYVGYDNTIKNPALEFSLLVIPNFVIWNQQCTKLFVK